MCGIVGYTGSDIAKNILVTGLKRMEYRGYDSVSYTHLFGITNVVGSPVARESDGVIYTKANKEIAVASTKRCV